MSACAYAVRMCRNWRQMWASSSVAECLVELTQGLDNRKNMYRMHKRKTRVELIIIYSYAWNTSRKAIGFSGWNRSNISGCLLSYVFFSAGLIFTKSSMIYSRISHSKRNRNYVLEYKRNIPTSKCPFHEQFRLPSRTRQQKVDQFHMCHTSRLLCILLPHSVKNIVIYRTK